MQKASKLSGTALMIITASSKIYLRRFFVVEITTSSRSQSYQKLKKICRKVW